MRRAGADVNAVPIAREATGLASRCAARLAKLSAPASSSLARTDQRRQLAPKTERGRRTIALDSATVAALGEHQAREAVEAAMASTAWVNMNEYVVTDELGRPIHPQAFTDRFKRYAKRAKLPVIRLHELRHSHATLARGRDRAEGRQRPARPCVYVVHHGRLRRRASRSGGNGRCDGRRSCSGTVSKRFAIGKMTAQQLDPVQQKTPV